MKLANLNGRATIIVGDRALDVAKASGGRLSSDPGTLTDLAFHGELRKLVEQASDEDLTEYDQGGLSLPIALGAKSLGVALNYRDHAEESNLPIPEEPTFFGKFASSFTGPYSSIHLPAGCDKVDFEAEVVVCIGSVLRHVSTESVWEGIAGVTAGQDISDRREQWRKPLNQFTVAKSYDTFSPLGPVLVTVDDFDDPDDVEIIGWVDDLQVQHGRTRSLIFSVPELVSWISHRITLNPGDLIFTGTPAGCGVRRTPRLYLQDGMTLRTSIPEVGTMSNRVVGDPA